MNMDPTVFDRRDFLDRLLGDEALMLSILADYTRSMRIDLATLRTAIEADDAESAARAAHKMKGASANVAAGAMHEWATQFEQAARNGDLGALNARLSALEHCLNETCRAMGQHHENSDR